jgi:hypothetical protein
MPDQSTPTRYFFSFDDAKLPSSQNHFRLLDLHPSPEESAPIICDISCHPVNHPNPKPYTALSYVWGSDARTHEATIGGKAFGITKSLDEALRHIRDRAGGVVTIWIDQICINQKDKAEKSGQVNLMGGIYAAAAQVLVWLGPEADDSDAVMTLWREVGLAARGLGIESYWTRERTALLKSIRRDEVLGEGDEMWKFQDLTLESIPRFRSLLRAMVAWTQRPWFRRVWVLQEFALPRTVPLFVCGKMRVEADLVYLALSIYQLCGTQLLMDEPRGPESKQMRKLITSAWWEPVSLFTTVRTHRQRLAEGRPGAGDTVVDILCKMYVKNGMDATDERDRVFAVLGLASDSEQLGLRANYGVEDCGVVYAQVAKALIQKAGRLDILSWSQFPKTRYRGLKTPLPTWAPDWRSNLAPSYHPRIIPRAGAVGQNALFSPSRDSLPSFLETAYVNVLALYGIMLCTVERVGNLWLDDRENAGQTNQEDVDRVNHLITIEDFCNKSAALSQSIYASSDRQAEAIWRVPIGDLYRQSGKGVRSHRSGQSMGELYALAVQASKHMASMEPSGDSRYTEKHDPARNGLLYLTSMNYMAGKRPFLAREGYVGMGPDLMAPDDVVVIFAGAHIPHVLRRGIYRYWEYVGEAYCDGVMDGEAWDADRLTPFYLV